MVGVTNVSKSTLINAIIQKSQATRILYDFSPGTTLDKIEIPLAMAVISMIHRVSSIVTRWLISFC